MSDSCWITIHLFLSSQATVSDTLIPIGKILIGAARPGFWDFSVAHDSFAIAMISMVKIMPGIFYFWNYRFLVFFTAFQGCDRAHVQKSEQFHNQHLRTQFGPSWCWFACLWKYSAGDIFVKINFDIYIDFLACVGIACGTTIRLHPGGNSQCSSFSSSIWFLTNLVKNIRMSYLSKKYENFVSYMVVQWRMKPVPFWIFDCDMRLCDRANARLALSQKDNVSLLSPSDLLWHPTTSKSVCVLAAGNIYGQTKPVFCSGQSLHWSGH